MNRIRRLNLVLMAAAVCIIAGSVMAEDENKLLPKDSRELLYRLLLKQSKEHYDRRTEAVRAALASPEAAAQRGRELKREYLMLIGDLPEEKTPLNPEVTGVIQCDGYRIEKVLIESRPNHHVTANVYVPTTGKGPFPVVIVPCGHYVGGKVGYQAVGILFAMNGFIAMIYDPLCQGERFQIPDSLHNGPAHSQLFPGSLLVGRTIVGYHAWDGMRCIDYLLGRDDVDQKTPIGMTGNSGGGNQTTFLMGLDERIGPARPSCFTMQKQRKFETLDPGDGCQALPHSVARRIDHADFSWMRAPKPTLILAAERDYVDFKSTKKAAEEIKQLYTAPGKSERTDLFSYNDKHGFSKPRREAAVAWMKRWLMDDPTPVTEPEPKLHTAKALQVTTTGQVLTSCEGELTVAQRNHRRAKALAADRKQFWEAGPDKAVLAEIKQMVGSRKTDDDSPVVEDLGTIQRDGYSIQKLIIRGRDQFPVPALLFATNGEKDKRPATIYVDGRGKSNPAAIEEIEKLVLSGRMVLSIDVRGFGETADRGGNRKRHGAEYRTANLAIQLAVPLLGQRVDDVLAAVNVLSGREDVTAIDAVGVYKAGPVVLHAAAFDKRLQAVTLRDSIASWVEDVVNNPHTRESYSYQVFGALKKYDLPDLAKCISPRPVAFVDSKKGSPRMPSR